MQIKRVDDKPMMIHVKEKPKLRTKGKRHAQLKGRAVLTVTKGPKVSEKRPPAFKTSSGKGSLKGRSGTTNQRRTTAMSSPLNQCSTRIRGADKKRGSILKTAGMAGAKQALSNMEGGDEVFEAGLLMEAATRPVRRVADLKRYHHRKNTIRQKRGIKQVRFRSKVQRKEVGSELAQTRGMPRTEKRAAAIKRVGDRRSAANRSKTRETNHDSGQTVMRVQPRKRMMERYISETRALGKKQDQMVKAAKKTVKVQVELMIKKLVQYLGGSFVGSAALIAIVVVPILAVLAMIYNSPFAIFFPSISSTETIQTVLNGYVTEFNQSVDAELNDISGYDWSEKIYVNYEGTGEPDNYYDILAVYMVKYGIGDTATDMTDVAKANLRTVFDDMRSYDITSRTEPGSDEDDTDYEVKCVNITMKSYLEMGTGYGFDEKQNEILLELMKPDSLALMGRPEGGAGPGSSIITSEQYQAILDAVSDENGKKVVAFVLSKVGYPYSQDYRDTGKYFDCSSLAYYAWKEAGVSLLYGGSNTAASEGQMCYDNNYLVEYENMEPGDLIFYSYSKNGRFLNISHVAVYVGDGMVVEAANEKTGVVYRSVQGKSKIVMIGRPR
ncbi:MAG: NlpC/P60 family protein [Clostridiales bacterium]|nr:NlpC/P60 family protein [Clostridiales bacterium]